MQQIPRNCTYLDDFPTFIEIVTHDDNLLGNFTRSFSFIAFIITTIIFLKQAISFKTSIESAAQRRLHLIQCSFPPIACFVALLNQLMPRTFMHLDFLITFYLCFCMFNFSKLIIFYQNGQTAMADTFSSKTPIPKIDLAAAPFFCCCKICFYKIGCFGGFSKKNIKLLWLGTLQAMILAPFFVFVKGVLMTDGTFACGDSWKTSPIKWLYLSHIFSMLTGIYCVAVLGKNTKFEENMKKHKLFAKTIIFQLFIVCVKLQPFLIKQFTRGDDQPENAENETDDSGRIIGELFKVKNVFVVVFNGLLNSLEFLILGIFCHLVYKVESENDSKCDELDSLAGTEC